jgi:DNA-3-methyladenine glycosylase
MPKTKLDREFYTRSDTLVIAKELLGKYLFTRLDNALTGGMIVETEAYLGATDRASHAFGGRYTDRTRMMYSLGGTAYVYLCYGIHDMFNIVTGEEGSPHAILIRAMEPTVGIEIMQARRKIHQRTYRLTAGPGAMAQALGINVKHSGMDLCGDEIWLEDHEISIPDADILASSRVGVAYAGDDAGLPYRFRIRNNPWTSPAK